MSSVGTSVRLSVCSLTGLARGTAVDCFTVQAGAYAMVAVVLGGQFTPMSVIPSGVLM